jgi:hypothetical protein
MLTVTHSELLLGDHCISRHFKFNTYNCSFIYQRYQPLYLSNIIFPAFCFELFLNLRGKIEKILYYTRFISHFVALVCKNLLVVLQQKKKLNDHRKIKLKDFYSIDKDKGKEVGYDIALLLESNPVQLS